MAVTIIKEVVDKIGAKGMTTRSGDLMEVPALIRLHNGLHIMHNITDKPSLKVSIFVSRLPCTQMQNTKLRKLKLITGGPAQPDYTQQWIEYLRAQGQNEQANLLEQQAKAAAGPATAASTSVPAAPGTTNGNGQAAATGAQGVDYSQQWAEHYRAIGKIAEAEAIENYIKANKVKFTITQYSILYFDISV